MEEKMNKSNCGYCGREIDNNLIGDEEVLLCDCYFDE